MKKILVIKTGASGDVVRTTTLLHLFKNDEIVWVTTKMNGIFLPQKMDNLKIVSIDEFNPNEWGEFSMVVSLEDDLRCASLASSVKTKELIGIYLDGDSIQYTAVDTTWFDMGLVSVHGKTKADELKQLNTSTYQMMLFNMFGKEFKGEEYFIREDVLANPKKNLIGLEKRAGDRWPTKVWNNYDQLQNKLEELGYEVFCFENRENIKEYIQDISKCSIVVSGDTLTMHLALALKIPSVGIFTCTSPSEIFGYERMEKIISPKLNDAFYTNEYLLDVLNAIKVEEVLESVLSALKKI
jgi:heptosyltransferase-2